MATREQLDRRRRFWMESAFGMLALLAIIGLYGLVDLLERAPL